MTDATNILPNDAAGYQPKRPGLVVQFVRSQPLGTAGLFIALIYVAFAFGADWIAPYDPQAIDFGGMLSAPSLQHPFGTDQFGRDVLSRVIHGTRTALGVGLISSFVGCSIGLLLGAGSAYFGGKLDLLLQALVDVMLSFPVVVLAMVIAAMFGKAVVLGVDMNLIAAIALPMVPRMARVARSSTLAIAGMPYVDAARAAGYGHTRIVLRHVLPNIVAPYLIMLTASVAQAILLEAALSFLGLGVTEPTPAWGLMLSGNSANFYQSAPWMIVFPGLAITLAVFAFNMLGDALRDWLDPKMKD
jgi:peptide/nickel transport system permease protein